MSEANPLNLTPRVLSLLKMDAPWQLEVIMEYGVFEISNSPGGSPWEDYFQKELQKETDVAC